MKFNGITADDFYTQKEPKKKTVKAEEKIEEKIEEKVVEPEPISTPTEVPVIEDKPSNNSVIESLLSKRKKLKSSRSYYLDIDICEKIDQLAKEYNMSMSEVANEFLRKALFEE